MGLRIFDVEHWCLRVIDDLRAGRSVESSRVELKQQWPLAEKVARQLAGHANAARGEEILWLIGLDESGGVHTLDPNDLSRWRAQLFSHFDSPPPDMTDVQVRVDGGTVVGLAFETTRAPFVVRVGGKKGSRTDGASREVPWREGTGTHSATHEDLVRLLVPRVRTPRLEVVRGRLSAVTSLPERLNDRVRWKLDIGLYVESRYGDACVIPFHRCRGGVQPIATAGEPVTFESVWLDEPRPQGFWTVASSVTERLTATIESTATEVIIKGPGFVWLRAEAQTSPPTTLPGAFELSCSLPCTDGAEAALVTAVLERAPLEKSEPTWVFVPPGDQPRMRLSRLPAGNP